MKKEILFCQSGGCTAKLGAGVLERILSRLPKGQVDPHLLIGYDSHDDAAVYQVSDDLAIVQTLDFFPPMVEDPYIFGQIAAANALSDVYAMGGEVKTALNIVCFDEKMDLNVLGQILQGGSEKVQEAGGSLVGGHSIADNGVKYGLSVMGAIDPRRIYANNALCCGDVLILTKKLGVGIVCCASRVQMASQKALDEAIASMTTLNKYAAEVAKNYNIHACSDVTGFGLLGHLHEMLDGKFSCQINTANILTIEGAKEYASEFLITAAAQKNRNHVESFVEFHDIDFAMEEILFDPQTSGGLLFSLAKDEAQDFLSELKAKGIDAFIVGEIIEKAEKEIYVEEK